MHRNSTHVYTRTRGKTHARAHFRDDAVTALHLPAHSLGCCVIILHPCCHQKLFCLAHIFYNFLPFTLLIPKPYFSSLSFFFLTFHCSVTILKVIFNKRPNASRLLEAQQDFLTSFHTVVSLSCEIGHANLPEVPTSTCSPPTPGHLHLRSLSQEGLAPTGPLRSGPFLLSLQVLGYVSPSQARAVRPSHSSLYSYSTNPNGD